MSDAVMHCPHSDVPGRPDGRPVAGLSVYFTYKGRHNQFRQVVYGRQMDAYFDITESMAALYTAAQNHLALSNPRLKGEDAREQFRAALRPEHERFTGGRQSLADRPAVEGQVGRGPCSTRRCWRSATAGRRVDRREPSRRPGT